ncbi:piggyBac transposable element-derived protein 4-like [Schistocerca cancellata]|uniref:piggyBac transposable element-derived protein 4-like n=1 Tax=Schistocerca cancellata TaxID=274614 RepID=UPI002117800F|nr:piggyBac transposable element-derived protein 4-like [Schistocerca cancellata]
MFRRGLSDAEIADLINHSDTLDNVESDSDDSECNGVFEEDEIDDSLSSDEDENDVEGVASNPAAVPYPKDSEWTAVDTYRPLPVNTTPRQILVDIDESSSVLDCSKVFLTDSDVNELKRQTNLYASQTIQKKRRGNNLKPHSVLSSWKPVTISEMRRFLGIIFHMCVSKKPKIADHWSTNPVLSCNFCPHVMSRLRFTQILSCLHLVDNSNQKKPGEDGFHPLYKVLPYYNNLKERCIQAYRPSEKVTIDEGICPFRGRVSFRVYMQNKPHKYGLKVYAVAEASSGYVVNFEVYADVCSRARKENVWGTRERHPPAAPCRWLPSHTAHGTPAREAARMRGCSCGRVAWRRAARQSDAGSRRRRQQQRAR